MAAFQLERVTSANPVFDIAKLDWFNGEYIRKAPLPHLAEIVLPWFEQSGLLKAPKDESFTAMVGLLQERARTLADFPRLGRFFFEPPATYNEEGVAKHFTGTDTPARLTELAAGWDSLVAFEKDKVEAVMRDLAKQRGEKLAAWIHPARLALTGEVAGPGLFELAAILGRTECVSRLRTAAERIASHSVLIGEPERKEPTC